MEGADPDDAAAMQTAEEVGRQHATTIWQPKCHAARKEQETVKW